MKKSQPKIGFALKKITTEQFAILADAYKQGKDAEMTTQISFAINPANRMLGVKILFRFSHGSATFLLLEASCHFDIAKDGWNAVKQENEKLIFPVGFIQHLSMITVGTARGILHAKTENTELNQFIIPTINLTEILKEDLVFDLSNPEES